MTAEERAALVETVAQMFCSQVDLECSECKKEGGCWYTDTARAAIDLIRAEVLEEAARVADSACIPMCEGSADLIAAAIRALKDKP